MFFGELPELHSQRWNPSTSLQPDRWLKITFLFCFNEDCWTCSQKWCYRVRFYYIDSNKQPEVVNTKKSAGVPEFCRYWKVVVMQRTSSNGSQVGWVGWRQYEPLCSLWCKTDTARATISDRGPVDIRLTLSIPHNNTLISQQTKPLFRLILYSVYYICCITIEYNETTFSYIHCCYCWFCLCSSSQPGQAFWGGRRRRWWKEQEKSNREILEDPSGEPSGP